MLEISHEIIKKIAEELDFGMKCFYNLQTGELVTYPDELRMGGNFDEELWSGELNKVNENPTAYLTIAAMESHESFRVLEDFKH